MPQGHRRNDAKWNSLQSKRLGMDSRVVDGGLLLLDDPTTEQQVSQEKRGTPTDRPHGGSSRGRMNLRDALVRAGARRADLVVPRAVPLFDANGNPISVESLSVGERFYFERIGDGVVAYPADTALQDQLKRRAAEEGWEPQPCEALGCERPAEEGEAFCVFHEMGGESLHGLPLERLINWTEDNNGVMRWDGFNQARLMPRSIKYTGIQWRSTIIAPFKPRQGYWRRTRKGTLWVNRTGILDRDLVDKTIASVSSRVTLANSESSEAAVPDSWTRFVAFATAIVRVPIAEIRKAEAAQTPPQETLMNMNTFGPPLRRERVKAKNEPKPVEAKTDGD